MERQRNQGFQSHITLRLIYCEIQMICKFLIILLSLSFSLCSIASLPKNIVQTCKLGKSSDGSITITDLGGLGWARDDNKTCNNHYLTIYKDKFYGYIQCNNKPYFEIDKKKISIEEAITENEPPIEPLIALSKSTYFLKLDDKTGSYLCIRSPSEFFSGGDRRNIRYAQYYIASNAFDKKAPIRLYFYFYHPELIHCREAGIPSDKMCTRRAFLCPRKPIELHNMYQ